ncbi:hypothetical protein RB195_007475 [Necator americanus]|uniref:Uncharacterized protein n=1 Tax=Necator americanus TaxID=51031 RepID=A0ABR1BZX7_NECAM
MNGVKELEKKVDRQVLWDRLDEWSDRNISQVFKQAQPGDEIEVSIVVDFRNAPRYTCAEEKKLFMTKIAQLEARYMPK